MPKNIIFINLIKIVVKNVPHFVFVQTYEGKQSEQATMPATLAPALHFYKHHFYIVALFRHWNVSYTIPVCCVSSLCEMLASSIKIAEMYKNALQTG